jgi:hypothetical protein
MARQLLPLLLLLAAAVAVTAASSSAPPSQTFVVVGGARSHLQPAPDAVAEADKFALPTLPVSIAAAAGLPAVLTRLAPPFPLTADDAERVAQLAAAPPSADAAADGTTTTPPPRAAVLLHLLGVAPEHAEALAERVADTLTDLGAGVVRYLRIHHDPSNEQEEEDAASALVRGGGALAAANADASSSSSSKFRVLESPGVAERCGMDCLAHRLGGDVADTLRHAFGLDDPEEDAGEQAWEAAERHAVRAASVPGELLAGELASVLSALNDEDEDKNKNNNANPDAVHVYEATIAGMQLMRAADQAAVLKEARAGGSGGLPGAADDADARAHAAADAFLATLEAVHRAVASRHGGAGEVVVQVSLLPDAREIRAPLPGGGEGSPALALGGEKAAGAASASSSSPPSVTPAVLGGAEAAAMRAPYVAWKRNARRQLLQAAGAWDQGEGEGGDIGGHSGGGGGGSGGGGDADSSKARPFGLAATYWGVAILLVWAVAGAIYCLAHMPLAEDTLLFGAARRNKAD